MTANVEAMVREGIRAYRAGKRSDARALLEKAVEADQYNEQAWLWLSAVVDTPDEQRTCLENVLIINPNNENARQGLAMLTTGGPSAPPAPTAKPAPAEDDPFADLDFSSASSPPSAVPPPAAPESSESADWTAPPTATSSASSSFQPPEPSGAEYDDWVAGLNLGASSQESENTSAAPSEAPAFDSPSAFGFDEDMFGADDDDLADLFSGQEESSSALNGPFGSATLSPPPPEPPPAPPPASMLSPTTRTMTSPGREDNFLDEISTSELSGGDFITDDYDADNFDDPDPSEYFARIPKSITASRLPGTAEAYSPLVLIGLVALVVLNIGAFLMLVSKLTG